MKKQYAKFMIICYFGWFRLEVYTIYSTLKQICKVIKFMYGEHRAILRKNYYRMLAAEHGVTERDIKES